MVKKKVIVDFGSCHMNDFIVLANAFKAAYEAGCRNFKLQLFSKEIEGNNLYLDRELFKEFVLWTRREEDNTDFASPKEFIKDYKYDATVFASVWTAADVDLCVDLKIDTYKIAWSQRFNKDLIDYIFIKNYEEYKLFPTVYVSYSFLDDSRPDVIPLLCIPEYPVLYTIDFSDKMFEHFSGFSDHTLGISQTLKLKNILKCRIIEKHFNNNIYSEFSSFNSNVPDTKFAIDSVELQKLISTFNCKE